MNILTNGNIVSPNGASLIFGENYINETLQTNDQSYLPYEIIITEDGDTEPIPASEIIIDGRGEANLYNYLFNTNTNDNKKLFITGKDENNTQLSSSSNVYMQNNELYATKTHGAVWNDYAEYRSSSDIIEPGYCVVSSNSGKVNKTTEKLQCCDGIVSDTFGFAIGETDICKTPLAVAGRVLAYTYDNRESFNAGDVVCAGPEGKIMKMSREEIREWPDRIVGIVSEIPDYEIWGSGNIKVNDRIWIKVK